MVKVNPKIILFVGLALGGGAFSFFWTGFIKLDWVSPGLGIPIFSYINFFGGFMMLAAGVFIYWYFVSRPKAQYEKLLKLRLSGVGIDADYIQTDTNYKIKVNYQHPFIVICQGVDPHTGRTSQFKSWNLWYNPEPFVGRGTKIRVWFDRSNPQKYIVDVDALREAAIS